jgi:predicted transcriptional regulator
MNGREYLQHIKKELQAGHYQHKKGSSILAAFGFIRRRQSAILTINQELDKLGLRSDPPISETMPLDSPHIRFLLDEQEAGVISLTEETVNADEETEEKEEISIESTITAFKVAELSSAAKPVEWIKPNAPLSKAYTVMCLKKYSQLVVAEAEKPLAIHIKGAVSYQSMANALINGSAKTVNDCLDRETPQVSIDDDIGVVIQHLEEHDVVIVIGRDKRLSGIVTAWDLAAEFEDLVGPFKWIGEIESRVKRRVEERLGRENILSFLSNIELAPSQADAEMLTLGNLVVLVQNSDNWDSLGLPFDRQEFCAELDKVRELRNRLMHFRDPLNGSEKTKLKRFCDVVRKIPFASP